MAAPGYLHHGRYGICQSFINEAFETSVFVHMLCTYSVDWSTMFLFSMSVIATGRLVAQCESSGVNTTSDSSCPICCSKQLPHCRWVPCARTVSPFYMHCGFFLKRNYDIPRTECTCGRHERRCRVTWHISLIKPGKRDPFAVSTHAFPRDTIHHPKLLFVAHRADTCYCKSSVIDR